MGRMFPKPGREGQDGPVPEDTIRKLIGVGEKVDARGKKGNTALHPEVIARVPPSFLTVLLENCPDDGLDVIMVNRCSEAVLP